jgi:hypothetical protein
MTGFTALAGASFLLFGLLSFLCGCVVAVPREGYYDHDHSRWYHDGAWHECGEHDEPCREHGESCVTACRRAGQ